MKILNSILRGLMAIYRPVFSNIWKDPTFESYKPAMKLIFIYLITNDSTTESGIYPITIKTISNETGISLKIVEQLLANGLKNVVYDFDNNFVLIKNFLKYNGGGRPDLLHKSVEKNYRNFNTHLWNEFVRIYPEYLIELQTVSKQLINRSDQVASISIAISSSISISNSNINSSDLKNKSEPSIKISFNFTNQKWEGITENDIELWNKAYPACSITAELAKMKAWILGAGAKGKKSNWRKFITNWLSRTQDRGGTK